MPDPLRNQLQTSLGPAYTLERKLGGGGMSHVAPADLAITAVAAGRPDEAFDHLERGDLRSASIGFEHRSYWDALRSDPRFAGLRPRSRGSAPATEHPA